MRKCMLYFYHILFFTACWALLTEDNAVPARESAAISSSENTSSKEVDSEKDIRTASDSGDLVNDLGSSVDVQSSFDSKSSENVDDFNKQVFAEATSQNSGVANEITNSGPPVVVTLADVSAELKERASPIISSQNENTTPVINQSNGSAKVDFGKDEKKLRSEPNAQQQTEQNVGEKLLIVTPPPDMAKENLTEEIPSFSEWAQKQLEEAEKNKEPQNASAQQQHVNGKQGSGAKFRWKNYASLDCGAKVVASNPEAISPSAVLSPLRDEYKLNTCTSRIWFIVELCEAIQAKKIDFANFELFSSSPKDFTVSVSDRFPTREWSNVGRFTAKDERDIQSFDLHPHLFGKYIKVEVKSHYGSEHFCPISLFRVYGTSEFEVLQKEDPVHAEGLEDDDDDDNGDSVDISNGDGSKNLFSSATDAVISMVKKAAQVLGNKGNHSNQSEPNSSQNNRSSLTQLVSSCTSPSHLVVCDNCSDTLFGQVYELLSCHGSIIGNLAEVPVINKGLTRSNVCQHFGFDFNRLANSTSSSAADFVKSFFSIRVLGALCNTIAIMENKVVLNISHQYSNDTTHAVTREEEIVNIETSEPHMITTQPKTEEIVPILTDEAEIVARSTCSTDVSYTAQIRPTKTMTTSDLEQLESNSHSTQSSQQQQVAQQSVKAAEDVTVPTPDLGSERIVQEAQSSVGNSTDSLQQASDNFNHLPEIEATTESTENLEDHLELITEFNGDGHNAPNAPAATSATPQVQKESVFLRLSNRIKTLERNMSLSSQYLEELSKRYKKQVEEMRKVLDKTVLILNEETRRNKNLEERLEVLTAVLEELVAEKNSWSSMIYCMIAATIIFICFLSLYRKSSNTNRSVSGNNSKPPEIQRRKSIDVVRHSSPPKKKRRPSDQALKIVRSAVTSEEGEKTSKEKKKKKKKLQVQVKRLNSISPLNEESSDSAVFQSTSVNPDQVCNQQASAPPNIVPVVDWVERKQIEEIPFVLEESEHSSLEPVALTDKIDVPDYLKTATNTRLSRSLNGNGDVRNVARARKSASVDETVRRQSPAPSLNGNLSATSSNEDSSTPKKRTQGLEKDI